ncbi:rCG42263 [Rattus norvegicus]|uniref:RCG42263 n=1 Tax=Rattus norvegicus TaxID=10116 RepID=A6KG49_RAT|nr:rCG42263 [Rattus norvegicus]
MILVRKAHLVSTESEAWPHRLTPDLKDVCVAQAEEGQKQPTEESCSYMGAS